MPGLPSEAPLRPRSNRRRWPGWSRLPPKLAELEPSSLRWQRSVPGYRTMSCWISYDFLVGLLLNCTFRLAFCILPALQLPRQGLAPTGILNPTQPVTSSMPCPCPGSASTAASRLFQCSWTPRLASGVPSPSGSSRARGRSLSQCRLVQIVVRRAYHQLGRLLCREEVHGHRLDGYRVLRGKHAGCPVAVKRRRLPLLQPLVLVRGRVKRRR